MATQEVIRGSRQKLGTGSYSDLIPFGTYGKYIDMLSGLDLEQELKLGGATDVHINNNDDGSTTITENYAAEDSTGHYQLVTVVDEEGTFIIQSLYWVDSEGQNTLKYAKQFSIIEKDDEYQITGVLQ